MHTTAHRIHRPVVAITLACVLLAGPAAAAPGGSARASSAIVVPASAQNARWPREPASGPPAAVVVPAASPAPTPGQSRGWTLASVAAGLALLGACTAVATGLRLRPGRRVRA